MEYHRQLQNCILLYLDEEENSEENYQNLINFIQYQNITKDINEFRLFLHLIDNISNYHYRTHNFLRKVEKILQSFKNELTYFFTNEEILVIFKNNKAILLILIENNILKANLYFEKYIDDYDIENYPQYFENKINTSLQKDNKFVINQKNGENTQIFCKYIRDDNISEFIIYATKTELSLNMNIKPSIFETNPYLLDKTPTLIEYSAFFGSIQIFTYLYKNDVILTPSLWLYSIHGCNPAIFAILDENNIFPPNYQFDECLIESIKCHHNHVISYIKEDYMHTLNDHSIDELIELNSIKYYNFEYLPLDLCRDRKLFYYFCKHDYYNFVENYLKNKNIDINFKMNDVIDDLSCVYTPLLISVKYDNYNIVKLLLNQPNVDINFQVSCTDFKTINENLNALILTVINNNLKMAKLFLDNEKINVNDPLIIKEYLPNDKVKIDEYYLLHEAIISDDIEITKCLLSHKNINVNVCQRISTFSVKENCLKEETVLLKAIEYKNIEAVKIILENPNIDVNKISIDKKNSEIIEQTPLKQAIVNENYEIIELLLNHPKIDVNQYFSSIKSAINNNIKLTPLKLAIINGNLQIIKLLLDHPKIDVNQYFITNDGTNIIEQTPLIYSIYKKKYEIVQLLLHHPKIDVNLPLIIKNNKEEKSESPLIKMIESQNIDMINLLLSNSSIDVNKISITKTKNSEVQQTPLKVAVKDVSNVDIVLILLSHPNIDVNLYTNRIVDGNKYEENPLIIATNLNLLQIAQCLLAHQNIDVNAKYIIENENYTVKNGLIIAIEKGNLNFVKLFVCHPNIDVNAKLINKDKKNLVIKETALLHLAIESENIEIVRNILFNPRIDINIKSYEKKRDIGSLEESEMTTISYAVLNCNYEIMELLLLNKDFDVNAKTKTLKLKSGSFFVNEKSALRLIVKKSDLVLLKYLFDFLHENKIFSDDLSELMNEATDDNIKSFLYEKINKQH